MIDFKRVIERALVKAQGQPIDVQAYMIEAHLQIALDALGAEVVYPTHSHPRGAAVNPPAPRPSQLVQQPEAPVLGLGLRGTADTPSPLVLPGDPRFTMEPVEEAPPPRMLASSRSTEVKRTLGELKAAIEQNAPPSMSVQMKGGGSVALRRIVQAVSTESQGDAGSGFVKLMYAQDVGDDAPVEVFTTSDESIDLKKAIAKLYEAASGRYTKEKRTVKAQPAKPARFDLDDIIANSTGGDADEASRGAEEAFARMEPRATGEARELQSFLAGVPSRV